MPPVALILSPTTPEPGPAVVLPSTPFEPDAEPLLSPNRASPAATVEETPRVALTAPAEKLPLASRFTIALAVAADVGATFQAIFSVPDVVTGEPVTLKSEVGALSPTLVTVPVPVAPGNVCPLAKVIIPFLAIFSPVSLGAAVPEP